MNEFMYFAKAVSALARAALGSKPRENAGCPVVMRTSPLEREKTVYLPIVSLFNQKVSGKYFTLIPTQDGKEYRADISGDEVPENIMIPSYCGGKPVTEIRMLGYAERDKSKTVKLYVPRTVWKLYLNAIALSPAIESLGRKLEVIVDEQNPYLVTENGCIYSKDRTVLWYAQCESDHFTVPDTVTVIAPAAFAGNSRLTEVKLPPSVREIGGAAFRYCVNLRSINTENVETMGISAFLDCKELRDLICKKLRSIDLGCLDQCKKTEMIKFPPTLETVGERVFANAKCVEFYDSLKAPFGFFSIAYIVDLITVRSAQSGRIKFKIYMKAFMPEKLRHLCWDGWGEYAEFDFEEFDRCFAEYSDKSDCKVDKEYYWITAQLRLSYPYKLSAAAEEYYKRGLKEKAATVGWCLYMGFDAEDISAVCREKIKGARDLAELMYKLDDLYIDRQRAEELRFDHKRLTELKEQIFAMIEEFCRDGVYGEHDLFELIDNFSANGKTEYTARIMELRNSMFPYRDRFELE